MDWSNEDYVKVYTRETDDDLMLSWQALALWRAMLLKFDRSGLLETRRGIRGLAALVRIPPDVVEAALPELLADGRLESVPAGYFAPNFLAAQEASKSDRQRQKESRERRAANARVTNRDQMSRVVTGGHESSQPVTLTSADPDPLLPDPEDLPPARDPAAPSPEPAPPTTPPPGPSVPAMSPQAPLREDKARTQAIAGDQLPSRESAKSPAIPDGCHDQRGDRRDRDPKPSNATPLSEPFRSEPSAPRSELPAARREPAPIVQLPPGEPSLDQLWTELEQARERAASARGVAIQLLVAHDVGRHDLAELLAEVSRVGKRAELVAQVRHAIAAAEAESRVAPEPGKPDRLQWFTGAIFSPRNFRRLVAAPLKRAADVGAKRRREATTDRASADREPPTASAEDRSSWLRADLTAIAPADRDAAELVRMFGDSAAPPSSTGPARSRLTDDTPNPDDERQQT